MIVRLRHQQQDMKTLLPEQEMDHGRTLARTPGVTLLLGADGHSCRLPDTDVDFV